MRNRDSEAGGQYTFYLRINDVAQSFVEEFSYQEKRDLILASYHVASLTPTSTGIALTSIDLSGEYTEVTTGALAHRDIRMIRFVERIESDDDDDNADDEMAD